jgi:hypothetical protein
VRPRLFFRQRVNRILTSLAAGGRILAKMQR